MLIWLPKAATSIVPKKAEIGSLNGGTYESSIVPERG